MSEQINSKTESRIICHDCHKETPRTSTNWLYIHENGDWTVRYYCPEHEECEEEEGKPMLTNDTPLGSFLRYHRKRLGLSITEVVHRLNKRVSCSYINRVELYGDIPRPEMLQNLADILELDHEVLLQKALKAKVERAERSFKRRYEDK